MTVIFHVHVGRPIAYYMFLNYKLITVGIQVQAFLSDDLNNDNRNTATNRPTVKGKLAVTENIPETEILFRNCNSNRHNGNNENSVMSPPNNVQLN